MAFNKVTILGTLCNGAERFAVSLSFTEQGQSIGTPADLSTWADAVMGAFNGAAGTWGPTLKAQLGAGGAVTGVRVYDYPAIGGPAAAVGLSTLAPIAGSGTITLPPQCAIVFSLLTATPSRRTRGRFYWPLQTGTVSGAGKLTGPTTPANLALAGAQMVGGIADLAPSAGTVEPVVVSEAGVAMTTVIRVSVGDVIDTQRRRRDKLIETRSSVAVG